jgi:transcriptional regulator with XRE-family HTH domain
MTHEELLLFGERLYSRRNLLNFTQDFVSEKAGISLRFYQMIERGEKSVSLDTLIRLSDILTTSVDYLLFGDLSYSLDNPLTEALGRLSPQQREDALKILQLYSKACVSQNK